MSYAKLGSTVDFRRRAGCIFTVGNGRQQPELHAFQPAAIGAFARARKLLVQIWAIRNLTMQRKAGLERCDS
jgi:hypothetical protein